jgi:hypothetical protein
MLKPLSAQEAKKKLDAFKQHSASIEMYKLAELSDSQLRQLRSDGLSWVIRAVDKRWA